MSVEQIVALVSAAALFGPIIGAALDFVRQRRQAQVHGGDAADRTMNAAAKYVEMTDDRIESLEREVKYWRRGAYTLLRQLHAAGLQPEWMPNGSNTGPLPPLPPLPPVTK